MIKDKLKNAKYYYKISPMIEKGFKWLESVNMSNIKNGKYFIDGEDLYANVQEYETKETANYETHLKYIDIQYMIKGTEKIGVCDKSCCKTVELYNPETDLEFMTNSKDDQFYLLEEGDFMVFFPNDAHKPAITYNKKTFVKKVVVKVPVC